jgi:hypothetical protein
MMFVLEKAWWIEVLFHQQWNSVVLITYIGREILT